MNLFLRVAVFVKIFLFSSIGLSESFKPAVVYDMGGKFDKSFTNFFKAFLLSKPKGIPNGIGFLPLFRRLGNSL